MSFSNDAPRKSYRNSPLHLLEQRLGHSSLLSQQILPAQLASNEHLPQI